MVRTRTERPGAYRANTLPECSKSANCHHGRLSNHHHYSHALSSISETVIIASPQKRDGSAEVVGCIGPVCRLQHITVTRNAKPPRHETPMQAIRKRKERTWPAVIRLLPRSPRNLCTPRAPPAVLYSTDTSRILIAPYLLWTGKLRVLRRFGKACDESLSHALRRHNHDPTVKKNRSRGHPMMPDRRRSPFGATARVHSVHNRHRPIAPVAGVIIGQQHALLSYARAINPFSCHDSHVEIPDPHVSAFRLAVRCMKFQCGVEQLPT